MPLVLVSVQDAGQAVMDATLLQYQKAAARLAQKLEEDKLPVEGRITRILQRFCQDWQEDLDNRAEEVAESRSGRQSLMSFMQNMKWMEPLYERLLSGELPEEMVAGLWMIVEVWIAVFTEIANLMLSL